MNNLAKNKSYIFITPMIIDEAKSLSYFVGTYIRDNKYPDMRGSIFLVFKRNNTKDYNNYINSIKLNAFYSNISYYDADNNNDVLIFTVPYSFVEEYQHFINSRYSKFSNVYKFKIIDFHNINNFNHPMAILIKIFNKDPLYKKELENKLSRYDDGTILNSVKIPDELELYDAIDLKEETYG